MPEETASSATYTAGLAQQRVWAAFQRENGPDVNSVPTENHVAKLGLLHLQLIGEN